MSATTDEREVPTGPPPAFGDSEQAFAWVPVTHAPPAVPEPADDKTETRSEAPPSTSHRKHIGAIGAAGGIVGSVALWQAYGVMGLLAAGGVAAGLIAAPVAAYVLYKRRGRNRTRMGRSLRGRRLTRRNATSRLGSTGIGRGRTRGRLGGGKSGLGLGGKRGGSKLAGGRGKGLLGGKSAKVGGGKAGLGGGRGKGGLLGSRGRGGKLLGGGRGSGLGGKSRLGSRTGRGLTGGKKSGRRASTANRSGGLMSRARRGGLNLGRRGGKAAGGAFGRWSKSTGSRAGVLSRKAAVAARRRTANAARRAANTRAGRRVAKAVQAARQAHSQSAAKTPFARWRAAARAAHRQMPRHGRPYTTWATGAGAGLLALLALLGERFKQWQAKRRTTGAQQTTSSTRTPPDPSPTSGPESKSRWESSTVHDSDEYTYRRPHGDRRFTPPPRSSGWTPPPRDSGWTPPPHSSGWTPPPPTIRVDVIRDEPTPQRAIAAPLRALGPGQPTETDRKEPRMSGFILLDAAREFAAVAAKYKPEDAHQLAPDFDQLPEVVATLAAGFRHFAQRIDDEEPVEAPVGDALFQLFDGIHQQVAAAEQIGSIHRKVHAREIERGETPRRGEHRWNTPVNA